MSGALLARSRVCRSVVVICALAACSNDSGSGARVEVVLAHGAPAPQYLLFDWSDSHHVLVHDRRVPETGSLDPDKMPLALIQIGSSDATDPQRTMQVRGLVGEDVVARGTTTVSIVPGSWQQATLTLLPIDEGGGPDAGTPIDAAPGDDAGTPVDANPSADSAVDAAPPIDAGAVDAPNVDVAAQADLPVDLAGPDLPLDHGPDVSASIAVSASADSFVEQGQVSATQNHGKDATLEVKSQAGQDNNRIAFFRFPLALAGSAVNTAVIRVYGRASVGTSMDSVYAVTDETWTETGITWNNKPALGMKLATLNVGTIGQYREWPVTAFLKTQLAAGRTTLNVAVSMDNDTVNPPDTFNAREAPSNPPVLVITR